MNEYSHEGEVEMLDDALSRAEDDAQRQCEILRWGWSQWCRGLSDSLRKRFIRMFDSWFADFRGLF